MTINYTLVNGPGRHDLILGLTQQKIVSFRGIDRENRSHLFNVRVIKLGLLENGDKKFGWEINGCIMEKNGRYEGELKKCRADFNAQKRCGSFCEEDAIVPYSYEYFTKQSDAELQRITAKLKADLPKELRELEAYAATLEPRERLILEAMHAWELSGACLGVKMGHQLNVFILKDRASRQ